MTLITDLDNTLYNWVDYFAKKLRAMIHVAARKGGIPEEELTESFRNFFRRRGSLEYPLATVSELDVFRNLSESEDADLRNAMYAAYSGVKNKRLILYDGVKPLLEWCLHEEVPVIAVTNAPIEVVLERFRFLDLQQYFSGIAAPFMDRAKANKAVEKLECGGMFRGTPGSPRVYLLEEGEVKPSSRGYARILADWQNRDGATVVLGDSLNKDLKPAAELGCETVWARYGIEGESDNMATLLEVTPWSGSEVKHAYESEFLSRATVDDAVELLAVVSQYLHAPGR